MPTDSFVSEDLENVVLTLGDIALQDGPDVLSAYLEALQVNGHKAEV